MTIARLPLAVLLLAFAGLVAAGCQKQPHIERYQVAKPVPIESVAGAGTQPAEEPAAKPSGEPTDRMLGAILPHGEAIWFFKLMGKKDAVASLDEPFTALVKSVHFAEGGKPQWTLPEGWHESPGPARAMRPSRPPSTASRWKRPSRCCPMPATCCKTSTAGEGS